MKLANDDGLVFLGLTPGAVWTDGVSAVRYLDHSGSGHKEIDISLSRRSDTPGLADTPGWRYVDDSIFSVLVGGGGTSNYFHWMIDVIPRIIAASKTDMLGDTTSLVVPSLASAFQRETLAILGWPLDRVVQEPRSLRLVARRVIATSGVRHSLDVPGWAVESLRNSLLDLKPGAEGIKRFYVRRGDAPSRRVVNELALEDQLKSLGFQVVALASLTVRQQISLFNKAEIIVAPHGAGLTNVAFASPGSTIVEISSPRWGESMFQSMTRHVGARYVEIQALRPVWPQCVPSRHLNHQADVETVVAGIRKLT